MPLDTSSYSLALLRVDGRRWNELRRIRGQISTQAAADGSSYLEMGNTKVICTISGPEESRRGPATGIGQSARAQIQVDVNVASFSGMERKKRSRADKRTTEMQSIICSAFESTVLTRLYPHSTIHIRINVLSQDGSLLAACINASTLALLDAGVPMTDYIVACTAGSTSTHNANDDKADPLLDLNGFEEQELPFLTIGTLGPTENISVLVMETRVRLEKIEEMLAVGVDGCKQMNKILDGIVRDHGTRVMEREKITSHQ